MSAIDITLIIIAFLCFLIGWRIRGVYLFIIPLAFFVGIIAANYGHVPFLKLLTKSYASSPKGLMISYAIIFLFAVSSVVIAGIFLAKFLDVFKIDLVDKALGGFLMIAVAAAPVYYMLIWGQTKIKAEWYTKAVENSVLLPFLAKYAAFLIKLELSSQVGVLKSLIR